MYKSSISLLPLSEYCRTTTGIYELHEREPIRQTNVLGELTEGPGADGCGPEFRHCRSSRSHNQSTTRALDCLNKSFEMCPIFGDIRLPYNHLPRVLVEFQN